MCASVFYLMKSLWTLYFHNNNRDIKIHHKTVPRIFPMKDDPICHLESIRNYFGWALKLSCHVSITQDPADICFLPATMQTDPENLLCEYSCRKHDIDLCRKQRFRKLGLKGVCKNKNLRLGSLWQPQALSFTVASAGGQNTMKAFSSC